MLSHKDLARLCWDSYSEYEDFGTFSGLWHIEDDTIYFAITGSNDRVDWIYNARAVMVDSEVPNFLGRCHCGFMDLSIDVAKCLRMVLEGRYKNLGRLVLTGHSLGGALAVMASLRLPQYDPQVITFGAPRCFDRNGAIAYNVDSTHYVYGSDLVPFIPRGYSHYRNTRWLNKPSAFSQVLRKVPTLIFPHFIRSVHDHSIENYYNAL